VFHGQGEAWYKAVLGGNFSAPEKVLFCVGDVLPADIEEADAAEEGENAVVDALGDAPFDYEGFGAELTDYMDNLLAADNLLSADLLRIMEEDDTDEELDLPEDDDAASSP
jgi:hypothetical protein